MSEQQERLQNELSLLEAMFPTQVEWHEKRREVTYTTDSHTASFVLRLPDGYLLNALPDVLSATIAKTDVREKLKLQVREQSVGEEILDSIISAFDDLVAKSETNNTAGGFTHTQSQRDSRPPVDDGKATVVVWLHHLLNTNKRKQALSPTASGVSGVTKPGYPGVLIYSGSKTGVYEHVNELKHLNWQAFQVRLESSDEWLFRHGLGVTEVESMGDVVAEVGSERKEEFLDAMRMR